VSTQHDIIRRLELPALGLVALVAFLSILFRLLNLSAVFNPPALFVGLNIVLISIPSFFVAILAALGFLSTGVWAALWLGGGALGFGLASLLGSIFMLAQKTDTTVVTHNILFMIAALCNLLAAFYVLNLADPLQNQTSRRSVLIQIYSLVIAVAVFVTISAVMNVFPPFFIQGAGGTPLRQVVVALTAVVFLIGAAALFIRYYNTRASLFYWYSLALLMAAAGAFDLFLQTGLGTPLNWLGRIEQFLSSAFLLVAALVVFREAHSAKILPETALAGLFSPVQKANLELVFDSMDDAVISTDTSFRINGWNHGAETIYGWKAAEVMDRDIFKLLDIRYLDGSTIGSIRQKTLTGGTASGGVVHRRRDGREVHIFSRTNILKSSEDKIIGLVFIFRDVTERRDTMIALRNSEAKANALIKYAPTGIFEIDYKKRCFVSVNEAMCQVLGYSRDELLEMSFFDLLDERSYDLLVNRLRRQVAGKPVDDTAEYIVRKKDGTILYTVLNVTFNYTENRPEVALIVAHDITDRKKAEAEIQIERDRLIRVMDAMQDGICLMDEQYNVVYTNPSMQAIYGPVESRKCYNYFNDYRDVCPWCNNSEVLTGAVLVRETVSQKTGRTYEITDAPLKNADGTISKLALFHDITERKKIDELKDDFIGMVSHELKTPLTIVMGAINTALSDGVPQQEARSLLNDASWGAETMSDIVDNLLELSRWQANRLTLSTKLLDISGPVDRLIRQFAKKHPSRQLFIDIPDGLPQVNADPIRIERILDNLLDNAVKYSPQGGDIVVTARLENGSIVLGVHDRGIGISAADRNKLFQPFQRLGVELDASLQGVGLGLVVCRRLVEAHHGRIWVESKPGEGSSFYFTLPIDSNPLPPGTP
jgi:PAS domain S-box-containing protein